MGGNSTYIYVGGVVAIVGFVLLLLGLTVKQNVPMPVRGQPSGPAPQ